MYETRLGDLVEYRITEEVGVVVGLGPGQVCRDRQTFWSGTDAEGAYIDDTPKLGYLIVNIIAR